MRFFRDLADAFAYAIVISAMCFIAYMCIDTFYMQVTINSHVKQSIAPALNLPTMNQDTFK